MAVFTHIARFPVCIRIWTVWP